MEVIFTLMNEDKVLENDEDLKLTIYVNDKLTGNDPYLIQISHKDQILYSEQIDLFSSKSFEMTIKAENFTLINGAVL